MMNGGVHCCKVAISFAPNGIAQRTYPGVVVNDMTEPQERSLAINNSQLAADVKRRG